MIYATGRIGTGALGSANLWVAHNGTGGLLHLRSEEREGYFDRRQLIVSPGEGTAGSKGVNVRANRVWREAKDASRNSAGGLAFVTERPHWISISQSEFDSKVDLSVGVTHVLSIPLYDLRAVYDVPVSEREGMPLAITVDFSMGVEPVQDMREELFRRARRVMVLFKDLCASGKERIRLRQG